MMAPAGTLHEPVLGYPVEGKPSRLDGISSALHGWNMLNRLLNIVVVFAKERHHARVLSNCAELFAILKLRVAGNFSNI